MKIKSIGGLILLGISSCLFAVPNTHEHAKANMQTEAASSKQTMAPGYCEVEIINDTFDTLTVYGTFDDGSGLSFYIRPFEAPHYINLYYYGYCHANMYLEVFGPYYKAFSGYLPVDHTLRVTTYQSKAKAAVSVRK